MEIDFITVDSSCVIVSASGGGAKSFRFGPINRINDIRNKKGKVLEEKDKVYLSIS